MNPGEIGPKSIHGKFISLLIALAVIPVLITLTAIEWMRYQDFNNKQQAKLEQITATQSLLLAEPLWNKDWDQISLNTATLIADPEINAIRIFDQNHKTVFAYGSNKNNQHLSKKQSISFADDASIHPIGYIEISLSDDNITSSIKQRLYARGLMVGIFLFIVICAYIALQYTVGRALKKLLFSIKKAEEKGVLTPVDWQSNDELGQIVKAYNAMLRKQKKDAANLREAQNLLEQRVAERTLLLRQEISTRREAEWKLRKQEQELKTFLNGVPVMLWMLEPDGKTMRFNESWLKFTGLTHHQEIHRNWNGADIHPDYRYQCMQVYRSSISQKKPFSQEYLKQNGEGQYRWISESGLPRYDDKNNYLGYFGICIDITDRKQTEESLYDEKERAQVTLNSIGEGVITTDRNSIIQFMNPIAEQLVGVSTQQALGKQLSEVFNVVDEKSGSPIPDPAQLCIEKQHIISHDQPILLLNQAKREFFIKNTTAPIYNQDRQITGTVLVFVDITEARQLSQQLSYQASHDPLTGLVNRREFENRVKRVLKTAKSTSTYHALCYMDLDQFKIINDTCGHMAGDELLRQLTGLLKHMLRDRDTLARLGGDEFGVLIEHCSLKQAEQICENLCKAVDRFRFRWENKNFALGISIGLVAITKQASSLEQLLIDADSACYVAKSSGRGRVHVYHENDETLAKRFGEMQWATQINNSLDENRFRLFWQPIYCLESKQNTHCEILLRMNNEQNQLVLPGHFFPAAERYNLATNIDQWVVCKAFSWIASLPEQHNSIQQFGINLSGHSLSEPTFLDFVVDEIKTKHIETHKICFEITETAVIENLSSAVQAITQLKSLGCQFALDDFGSGLSSFAYLKQLPIDYLKIDGFFVKGMSEDPIDLEMVRSIHKIGKVMGKQTIAECVENNRAMEQLQSIGVDFVQGYYVGKPKPIKDFSETFAPIFEK